MSPLSPSPVSSARLFALVAALLLGVGAIALADSAAPTDAPGAMPFLHPLFADNMVLQRDAMDKVWGWTTPGATVTVAIDGKSASAVAATDGKWMATIGRFKAGGPFQMTVTGPQSVTVNNVLFGDVWICSGQSNMEFGTSFAKNGAAEVAAANYPNIRLFRVAHTPSGLPLPLVTATKNEPFAAQWQVCNPATVGTGGWGGFSAVGYFFGRDLYEKLHVPIGLIANPSSGMPAEAFVSAGSLSKMADFADAAQAVHATATGTFSYSDYANRVDAWAKLHDPGSQTMPALSDPALDDSGWPTMKLPGMWSSKGITELAKFDGVMWYRTTFDAPGAWAGKTVTLHLGQIADVDTTYINGVRVGSLGAWTLQRDYPVPASLLKPTGNVIAIRIIDNAGNGGLWNTASRISIGLDDDPASAVSLNKDWRYKATVPWTPDLPVPPVTVDLKAPSTPTVLWNGMVSPLAPFGIKGVIWYQGEANASRGYQYRTLMPLLISDWRQQFGQGDFPFLLVQLAGFSPYGLKPDTSEWAETREAQETTTHALPNVGMAVAIDIGGLSDIHPTNKQDVGKRLALAAFHIAYHQRGEYMGPTFESMTVAGSTLRVKFDHVAGGLKVTGEKLTGFKVAGPDKLFVPADAVVDGKDTVVLSVPAGMTGPFAVRYAFESFQAVDLYNGADLPAVPFRTDITP